MFHLWLFSSFHHGPFYRYIFPNLPFGVTLLFILSSFLLYRPFAAAVVRGRPRPSLRSYLANRALRILPAYWFILLCTCLVLDTAQLRDSAHHGYLGALHNPGQLLLDSLFLQNFYPSAVLTGIGPAWALTDIVVFYLLLPLLVLIAYWLARHVASRKGRSLAALAPAGFLLAMGLSGKAVASFVVPGRPWDPSWHAVIERSFWGHADFFALGIVVAVLRVESEDRRLRISRWQWAVVVAALPLIAISAAVFTVPEGFADGSLDNFEYDMLMAVACAIFLALVVLPADKRSSLLVRLLENPPLVALGVVSYSLYLWQLPILFWLRRHGLIVTDPGVGGLAVDAAMLGTVLFLASALTYRLIEFPALRRKSRVAARPAAMAATARHEVEPARLRH